VKTSGPFSVTAMVCSKWAGEQLATLRHELEQAPPRMIVLHVSLEMLGKIVDPL